MTLLSRTAAGAASSRGPVVRAVTLVAVAALVLVATGCRTVPDVVERDLVAYLPADQASYLFINDAATGEALLEALLPEGISAQQLSRVIDRTEMVVATVGRLPDSELNLVAAGRYPRRIIERNLRRDDAWVEVDLERGRAARSYFSDPLSGQSLAVLRSGLVLVTSGDMQDRLLQAEAVEQGVAREFGASLEARLTAIEDQADYHQLTIYFPQPGREALSRLGAPVRVPIDWITLSVDRAADDADAEQIMLAGVTRLESEQDARAFHVLFRLLFLAVIRDARLDMQRFSAQLESERDGDVVRFSGITMHRDEMRVLVRTLSTRFAPR